MISKKMEAALNDQIMKEAKAANVYLSMASWSETNGLRGSAEFLYAQSEEEREHMMKLVRYVNLVGGHALAPEVKEPIRKFKSIHEIFELALEHEQGVTASINQLVEQSLKEKDYATNNFLQWFVSEQIEEESLFRSILDMVKLAGSDGRGQFMVDNEINKLRAKK